MQLRIAVGKSNMCSRVPAVDDDRVLLAERRFDRLVHVVDNRGALIVRGVDRIDLAGAERGKEGIGISAARGPDVAKVAVRKMQAMPVEDRLERAQVDEEIKAPERRDALVVAARVSGGKQKIREMSVDSHALLRLIERPQTRSYSLSKRECDKSIAGDLR